MVGSQENAMAAVKSLSQVDREKLRRNISISAVIIFVAGQYYVVKFPRMVAQRLKVMWSRLKYLDAMSSELL